jgi:hypothetical protein
MLWSDSLKVYNYRAIDVGPRIEGFSMPKLPPLKPLPPLKTDPKYGYYPWWPEEQDWIHPDDEATARTLIPSGRIFRRDGVWNDGEADAYMLVHYGELTLRVRPTLWQEVRPEGFEIGEWVEVRTRGMANEPRTGTIAEIAWEANAGEIRYQIVENGKLIDTLYACDDLKPVEPPRLD